MSEWFTVEKDDVSLSLDGKTINVLFASNDWGNQYVEIPVEFIKNTLKAYIDGVRAEAIGWAHADACIALDHGFDPRQTEVPEMLARARVDLGGK